VGQQTIRSGLAGATSDADAGSGQIVVLTPNQWLERMFQWLRTQLTVTNVRGVETGLVREFRFGGDLPALREDLLDAFDDPADLAALLFDNGLHR
jgi:hypothetical protein